MNHYYQSADDTRAHRESISSASDDYFDFSQRSEEHFFSTGHTSTSVCDSDYMNAETGSKQQSFPVDLETASRAQDYLQ